MMINKQILSKRSKGFSLAEVLVVIAIIAIISAVGVANFSSTSIGTRFAANQISLTSIMNDYRYLAFINNKPYKFNIDNQGENLRVRVFQPTSIMWRNKNLMRRCNCQVGPSSSSANCHNVFSINSGQTPIETKTIEKFNIKKCNDINCTNETTAAVKFCFLPDGTNPQNQFYKLKDISGELYKIVKMNKTGYAE